MLEQLWNQLAEHLEIQKNDMILFATGDLKHTVSRNAFLTFHGFLSFFLFFSIL